MTTNHPGHEQHGQETGQERRETGGEVSRETGMHELDQAEQKAQLKALLKAMINSGELDRELAQNFGVRRRGHDRTQFRTREEQRG